MPAPARHPQANTGTASPPAAESAPLTPWRRGIALAALALMLFTYLTAEVFTAGALIPMHRSFDVPVGVIGQLVTVYAIVAALAILPMTVLTTRMPPWVLLGSAMALLGVTQLGIALAPSLGWVIALRAVSAVFHGAVWAAAPAVATSILRGAPGRATATVFIGSALGNVAGAPFVAAMSSAMSWRAASAVLAVVAVTCAVVLAVALPHDLPASRRSAAARRPDRASIRRVARWCALIVFVAGAHFASFTYIAERAADVGIVGNGLSALFLLMGGSGLLGTVVMARINDAFPRASTLGALMLMSAALVVVGVAGGAIVLFLVAPVWTGAYAALTVSLQAFVLRDAPGWAQLASSWYVLFFQVGIAAGSGLGALLLSAAGTPRLLGLVSGAIAGLALLGMFAGTRRAQRN